MLAATAFTFTTSAMRRTQDLILIGRTGKLDFEVVGAMHVSCSIGLGFQQRTRSIVQYVASYRFIEAVVFCLQ